MFTRFSILILLVTSLQGALLRMEVAQRSTILNGRSFGVVGAYELLRGRAYFAVNPSRTKVTDILLAPTSREGKVEFSADFIVLRPVNPNNGNQTLLLELPNRGSIGMLQLYNRARASQNPELPEHFGDGLLLKEGYTLAWLGWQHDVPPNASLLRAYLPTAREVQGLVRGEFTPLHPATRIPLGDAGHVPYPVVQFQSLTVRDGIDGKRWIVPESEYTIEASEIVLKNPASPGRIYEFIYRAANPAIAGLGLAAVRDFVSAIKNEGGYQIKFALGVGVSQSAMALKALVYEGFNADEEGRRVFDGLQPHVAGGRRSTFERFAQPSRTSGPYRNASHSTTDQFPYSDAEETEPHTGRRDSILRRANAANVVPRIIYTNSSYEYFGSGGALIHTSLDGKRDLKLPITTRIYFLSGGQHSPAAFPPQRGNGENLPNWNDYRWLLRAALRNLFEWVTANAEPPESRYPMLRDGSLIPDSRTYPIKYLDFGPEYQAKGIAGLQPPKVGRNYTVLAPRADADGNDIAGVKMPWVSVPLGAFTGWNLRTAAVGATGQLLANTGSYIPFEEQKVRQLYPSQSTYETRIANAAEILVKERLLLPGDVPEILKFATRTWAWSEQRKAEPFERSKAISRNLE